MGVLSYAMTICTIGVGLAALVRRWRFVWPQEKRLGASGLFFEFLSFCVSSSAAAAAAAVAEAAEAAAAPRLAKLRGPSVTGSRYDLYVEIGRCLLALGYPSACTVVRSVQQCNNALGKRAFPTETIYSLRTVLFSYTQLACCKVYRGEGTTSVTTACPEDR